MTLTVGSLFAGIGGFDLGFERAGMRTEWFVEQDAYCQAVLRKHWPDVPIFDDVRNVGHDTLTPVDVLCGGFPCQDISSAGKGAGLDGERSGLWFEFERLIGELRPSYVVVENVPVLRTRGLDTVITGLARLGYDAEWSVVSAAEAGAPHLRKRIWIVAYPNGQGQHDGAVHAEVALTPQLVADTQVIERRSRTQEAQHAGPHGGQPSDSSATGATVGNSDGASADPHAPASPPRQGTGESGWWSVEPDVGRVADGIPARMDRLRALGNALVPQIAEWIGHQIVAYEKAA